MNESNQEWISVSEYKHSFMIGLIVFISIFVLITLLIYLGDLDITTFEYIFVTIFLFTSSIFIFGFVVKNLTSSYFSVNEKSIILKKRNKTIEYEWGNIKLLKICKPFNIEIHLKSGKTDGLNISNKKIDLITNQAKKMGVIIK